MADLESLARKAVSDFLVTEAIGICITNSNLTENLLEKAYGAMERKIDDYALGGEIGIEEAYALNRKMKAAMESHLISYDAGEDYIGEIERGWRHGKAWHKAQYDCFVSSLEAKGILLPERLKQAFGKIVGILERRERIIGSLSAKAEKSGIEAALCEASIKEAFKMEFKTKEAYIGEYRRLAAEVVQFNELAVYACAEAREANEVETAAEDAFALSIAESRIDTFIENEAAKIFG